jgi:hypothetical protein
MDLVPGHRLPFQLPVPWPARALGMLRTGAAWLHTGPPAEGLLALPSPVLTSNWDGKAWITRMDGMLLASSPWEALEAALTEGPGPWSRCGHLRIGL